MGKKLLNLLLFLLVGAACVVITLYVGRDQPRVMIYNFIFLGVMAVLYLAGMFGGMFRMDDLSRALARANQEIRSIFKLPGKASSSDLAVLDNVFDNKFLDKKMRDFTDGINKTEEGIGDIEDYINDEELDLHVHKRLLEMVPDIFTSLGILGTFVGLVWGLKNFQPDNYEAITSSVSGLVDGIKVAFLTSIYGIALSIVYSYGMKSGYTAMMENLQQFLNRFHSFVMPNAENESRNLLVSAQKIQADAMTKMTQQFTVQLADSFEKVITPTFRKMNSSLDTLVNAVTQTQTDAVHELLDIFLEQMNSSFRLQFRDFNKALDEMNKAQKDSVEFTNTLYRNMSERLNASFAENEQALRDSVTQFGNMQTRLMSTAAQITKENQEIQQAQQQEYEQIMTYMKDAEKSATKFWVAANQTMKKYVEAAAESMERVKDTAESQNEVQIANKQLIQDFAAKMDEFAEYQKKSYQTMDQVRRLLGDITATTNPKDVYLQGGRSDTIAQQRSFDALRRTIDEQGETEKQYLEEITRMMREMNKNAQKGKIGNIFR